MNSNVSIPYPKNDQYEYYPLDTNAGYALLAEDHEIAITPQTGQVILVNWERRHFVTDHLFTTQECAVLFPLLDAWPSYVPTDELLTGVRGSSAHQQQEPGYDLSLSHLPTVLSGCQERLYSLAWMSSRWVSRASSWSVSNHRTERSRQITMRIKATHLHALLHVKRVIEQMPLTQREREVLRESLERAYDRAECLLTPQVLQMLADDETTTEEGEDTHVSRVSFP